MSIRYIAQLQCLANQLLRMRRTSKDCSKSLSPFFLILYLSLPILPFSKPPVVPQCLSISLTCQHFQETVLNASHAPPPLFLPAWSVGPITSFLPFLYFHVRVSAPPVCKHPDTSPIGLSPCKISVRPQVYGTGHTSNNAIRNVFCVFACLTLFYTVTFSV